MLYAKIETLQNFSKSHLVAIGNHTANHYLLSSLKKDEQKKEIINGKIFLDRHGIKNELVFAAPFGGYKSINKLTLDILEEHDYKGLFLTNGISRVDKSKLPRPTPLAISNRFLPH